MWLRANLKVYRFLLPYLPYTKRWQQAEKTIMIKLKSFKIEDWEYLKNWISSESELIQFAGQIFTFPIDQKQVELYLSDPNRTVFKIENENYETIGIAEISIPEENVAKLARILIGEKSMRGKGIGTELINKLTEYGFHHFKKEKIILNVYSWNIGAIKCYEKVGFSQSGKPTEIVKVGNEEWRTIEMEKKPVANRVDGSAPN
jgi:RimJ/RimL family protein N-acetyltransferase